MTRSCVGVQDLMRAGKAESLAKLSRCQNEGCTVTICDLLRKGLEIQKLDETCNFKQFYFDIF